MENMRWLSVRFEVSLLLKCLLYRVHFILDKRFGSAMLCKIP